MNINEDIKQIKIGILRASAIRIFVLKWLLENITAWSNFKEDTESVTVNREV
ncbi:hypothetical protein N0D28_10090 [Deinococcus rubellus]|uniref:Uncharacterized protein n=1 Tax=Deinococcus rubellus TaxID=1889240 RepID=A0ABY5YDJ2_9DEIO|nr:hypothetical protein [Deinococcus rubellus]UWX63109.1 hypothetical protein N0D28_10090 [Deinococcus rubellus]